MRPLSFLKALSGAFLDLRFRPNPGVTVEIVERPGAWMDPADLDKLITACRQVVAACLNGRQLDYGLFAHDGAAWSRSVVTLIRRSGDGRPIAFNAMPLLSVVRAGQPAEVLHLGLVMVDPAERSGGLSWILYGLTCFALFLRRGLRPLWISSVTQVPAVVGMVAETFDEVYPAPDRSSPTFAHRHIAHQIISRERSAFGVGEDAGFDPDRQIISNAYTGGSDNLKKSYDSAAKHRDERYNRFCAEVLDYDRGDDLLQIGRIDLATACRYLQRSVPRHAIPQLLVQGLFIAISALLAPLVQWLDAEHPMGRLRPAR